MKLLPVLMLLGTVGLGLFMGQRYLRGVRRNVGMIALHLLLGAASIEVLVESQSAGEGRGISAATLLLGAALLCGLTSAVLRRRSPRAAELALLTHASAGAGAFLLVLAWAAG